MKKGKLLGGLLSGAMLLVSSLLLPVPRNAKAQTSFFNDSAAMIALGKQLFRDTTLSNPAGMACVTCHDPKVGFSYPNSDVNAQYGPVPGVVPGRFGFRLPPSAAYAAFLPTGIPHYDSNFQAYVGGLFWDGRAANASQQAEQPFLNPNEMNNLIHDVGDPAGVVHKVDIGPSGPLFRQVFGQTIFLRPVSTVYSLIAGAIAVYERSSEVSPFSSKYDAYLAGKAQFTAQEQRGLKVFTGTLSGRPGGPPFRVNAHCVDCHGIPQVQGDGPDLWTNSCYANLGVPRNPNNPYYTMTDPSSNPDGYNRLGSKFIDYGLGDFLYPLLGKASGDLWEGDPLAIDGTFKAPSLRNVAMQPTFGFVRAYMHNGVFKSLKQVVHFYNTRNLTTVPGEVIDFTQPDPYAHLQGTPLWPRPEWPSPVSMINPQGLFGGGFESGNGMAAEQIGNMGLTDSDEDALVAFLRTLTDGYFKPDNQSGPVHP